MPQLQTPDVSPGAQTSELSVAKTSQILSVVLIAIGGALSAISAEVPSLPAWVGLIAMVVGALKAAFAQKTYTDSRTAVKIASAASAGVVVGSLDEAAKLIGALQSQKSGVHQ